MKQLIVKDYNLTVELGSFINIIGPSSSGKTRLLRMLINQIPNSSIYLDDRPLITQDISFKKQNITAAISLDFNTTYVKEELLFYQDKCGYELKASFDNLDKLTESFDLEEIINQKVEALTIDAKALVKILSLLVFQPLILGIDNLLSLVDAENKLKIIKYAKENDVTILNVTTNSEELLLGNEIIVLENGKVKSHDKSKKILADEKILPAAGLELPFILSLSKGLNYYNVLNKSYYDLKTLVRAIWK